MTLPPIVLVTWWDIAMDLDDHPWEAAMKAEKRFTVGFLMNKESDVMTLAGTCDGDVCCQRTAIPVGCIEHVQYIGGS